MPAAVQDLFPFSPGKQLIDGSALALMVQQIFSITTGITAKAGGGVSGTQLTAYNNEVNTVAADNDSVVLPPAIPGSTVWINNNSAHSLQVFGNQSNQSNGGVADTIAAHSTQAQAAAATGVAQASALGALYKCTTLGQWKQLLSA